MAITAVATNSDAARKGIARGAIMLSANGPSVPCAELESVLQEVQDAGREAVLLRVKPRRGPHATVPVRLRDQ